jgi:uncharacterized protein (TIRG00374 family)
MLKKTWLRLGIALSLTAIFLYFFLGSVDWRAAFHHMTHANVGLFLVAVLLTPLHLFTRGLRWKILIAHEKKDVRLFNLFAGNAVGFSVTFLFPGRLGELVKPLYLARKERIRPGFAIGTVVVERIFDIFTMCFLLGVFLLSRPLYESVFKVQTEAFTKLTSWGIIGVTFASVLLAVSLLFYFFKDRALRGAAVMLKVIPHAWADKILNLLHEFIDGLRLFHSLGDLVFYIVLSFVVWLGITFYYWFFFLAYRVAIPYFFLIPYIFLTMVGASIPTPGMVGGFHAFSRLGLTLLYPSIFPKNDPSLAVGLTIVVHALQLIVTCLIGYAIVWREGLSLFQIKKLGEKTEL